MASARDGAMRLLLSYSSSENATSLAFNRCVDFGLEFGMWARR